ncbi:Sulfotransfer-1 domain-containing protein [Aphelenchoides fujianensis]|nr:Sulfotransfer-1 domain-containing protein [Aphelenchoides fujianensis]
MRKCGPTDHWRQLACFFGLLGCVITIGHSTPLGSPHAPQARTNTSESSQRFPDAIIIGVKKSGTRALLEFLKINPLVKAPAPEVHFFDKNYDKGYEWYKSQMPFTTDEQITIEKSPAYFVSKFVPQRVHKMNPHMKLIVVVRNPITRAISDYTQSVTRRKRSVPFEPLNTFEEMSQCSTAENSTKNPKCVNGINSSWGAVRIGVYHRYLRNWLRFFPISQFLFVDGERLIRNPAVEIRRAEHFLGIPSVVKDEDFVIDSVKKFPCVRRKGFKTPHCLGKSKGPSTPRCGPGSHQSTGGLLPARERAVLPIDQLVLPLVLTIVPPPLLIPVITPSYSSSLFI